MPEQITNPGLAAYARIIQALSHFIPHHGQIKVGRALFNDNIRNIFVQCGRKWGKTELGIYFDTRWGMQNPGLGCFYIAPELKQARKLVWEDPRLLQMVPPDWIDDVHNSDMRIRLKNGAYIKVEGSDNFEAHRGTRPGLVIYEEFKDHDPRFRNIMRPNLSVYNAPEIFLGTPPDRECEYTEVAKEHKMSPASMFFYQAPTWENPHISRQWLLDEKRRLYLRGEGDVWEREYEAKYVKGGAKKIFPMWGDHLIAPHAQVLKRMERDRKRLEYILWNDPASTSCFGTLFVAINPFTREIFVLDEIYEQRQNEMSVRKIAPVIFRKRDELWRHEWTQGYDEAAAWFANEMADNYEDEAFEPTHKSQNNKLNGLSLMKDVMSASPRKLWVSDRCVKFAWEVDNYYQDKNGNIPKENDHLIDDFRYILGHNGYVFKEDHEVNPDEHEDFRGSRIKDDFPDLPDENADMEDLSGMGEERLWKM